MRKRKTIISLSVSITLILLAIIIILILYNFNLFKPSNNSYTVFETQTEGLDNTKQLESTEKENNNDKKKTEKRRTHLTEDPRTQKKTKTAYNNDSKKNPTRQTSTNKETAYDKKNVTNTTSRPQQSYKTQNTQTSYYSKGSALPDQDFDSYGEYISEEEKSYRTTLIKNLTIKTIIIDSLTKGNGISQEFFKVVYREKMIPAKILEQIVESKEFRDLIPKKYLSNEIVTKGLPKGERVIFKNSDIKEILTLWRLGRLTPIQKAWKVKAEK